MGDYNWDSCPSEVKLQVTKIKAFLAGELNENLVGIYIHGSLCLGWFQPTRSDLDIVVIVDIPLDAEQKYKLMLGFLGLHNKPTPIELSIVCYMDLQPWIYPPAYQFHFSDYWREKYEHVAKDKNLNYWENKAVKTDYDLACHISLINQYGISIYGPQIEDVFPGIPESDFWDSIVREIHTTDVFTLIRIWSYKENKIIFSKAEAGEWSLDLVPSKYHYIVRNMIDVYCGKSEVVEYDSVDMKVLKQFLIEQIT